MCLAFSQLQVLNTKPANFAELLEQGKRLLEFACSLAELQIERGGRVLFEHPLAALDELCLRKLLAIDGMRSVRCDQCQFGMTSVDCAGNMNRRCLGGHDHVQLSSGSAKSCEKYPPRLVAAILRALRQSTRAAGCGEAQGMMGN